MAAFHSLLQQTVFYAACIILPYCFLLFSYRIFFHPLSKYPGPLLAKLTDGYGAYHASFTRLHLVTWRDHFRFGPVIRHGPNKLVFNSAQALKDIYVNDRVVKSHAYLVTLQASKTVNVFNAIDKQVHRLKRKVVGATVNERSMRHFEPIMRMEIEILLSLLLSSCQAAKPVNMTGRLKRLGMDIVGRLAFGQPHKTQTDKRYRFLLGGILAANYHNNIMMQFPSLAQPWILYPLKLLTLRQQQKGVAKLGKLIQQRLNQDKHAQYDLYSIATREIETQDIDEAFLKDIWAEGVFFYAAGGDTTATALCALFFYLSRNPDCYQKLAHEVRSAFTNSAEIQGSALSVCQYLRACIDEALRMSPPVSGTLWRECPQSEHSNGPFVVDGHVIPQGTQVGVSAYALHHNERYFPEPFKFRPERWLEEDKSRLDKMHDAFCAFSLGYRGCAGKAMAYLEAGLVIAKTLWYFDFEIAPGKEGEAGAGGPRKGSGRERQGEFQLYDIVSSTHSGPTLLFHTRGEFWRELDRGSSD